MLTGLSNANATLSNDTASLSNANVLLSNASKILSNASAVLGNDNAILSNVSAMLSHAGSILSNAKHCSTIQSNAKQCLSNARANLNRTVSPAVHSKTNLYQSLPDFKKVPIYHHLSSILPALVLGVASLQFALKNAVVMRPNQICISKRAVALCAA